jgi:hypothetical protein
MGEVKYFAAWFHTETRRTGGGKEKRAGEDGGWKDENVAVLGCLLTVWRSLPAGLFTAPECLDS